ncbi:MAG: SDR family oxidoreductase [Rhodospirillaceae bacterium]|jgi:NAD(P)-dependent dehydrogenase (short-subunit alcohol dehydrogenase family)|nr:SDR family oxidoreductase [Rhodospirillaceae bacterium]MBT6119702.1 SDR family oxidoreductase [Rhodospirillaceae bacterium]
MAEQKVAVVTAASKGIGAAIARELHERGYKLGLLSRTGCKELAEELGAHGVAGSVTEEADIQRLVEETVERFGRLDAAVANSGRHAEVIAKHKVTGIPPATYRNLNYDPDLKNDIFAVPWGAWHDDLDLIVLNCLKLAKAVTPHLIAAGGGAIVNVSGMESVQPRATYPLGPLRLALHGFTKIYSDRYARDGIRMNCLLPGMIENASSAGNQEIVDAIPLGRFGGLKEMGSAAAFLASEDSGYITGQMIVADGGLNRGI